jgi:hypothetical protein
MLAAGVSPFPHLPRHPIHGALKWKPSGIPFAVVSRPRCGGQFQLSLSSQPRWVPAPPAKSAQSPGRPVAEKDGGELPPMRQSKRFPE